MRAPRQAGARAADAAGLISFVSSGAAAGRSGRTPDEIMG
jgi:hypothetical protein